MYYNLKYFFLFVILNSFQHSPFSQSKKTDSLLSVIKTAKEDTNKVKTLNLLGRECEVGGGDEKGINYAAEAKKLSERLNYRSGLASAENLLGNLNRGLGNYAGALEHLSAALKIREEQADKKGISTSLGNLGLVYMNQGNYPKALEFYLKALKIDEEIGNKSGVSRHYGNMGTVYAYQTDYKKSLDAYLKALQIDENLKDKQGVARHLSNIGIVYDELKDYKKSLEYYFRAIKLNEELGNKKGIARTLGNIGNVYNITQNYPKTLEYYLKALKLRYELGSKILIANSLGNIGVLYSKSPILPPPPGETKRGYALAEDYIKKALVICDSIGALNSIMDFELGLSDLYALTGKHQLALLHYKKYITAKDSLTNEENTKQTVRLEMNYEFDKKEAAEKLNQEKKEAVAAAESKKQKIIIYSVCGILLLVFAFAVFAYRSYLQKQKANLEITKQKELIEEKQKEILDSIYYARRIQRCLITSEKYIVKHLERMMR